MWHAGLAVPRHVESSSTRDQTHVSCIAGGFFTTEPPGKPHCGVFFCINLYLLKNRTKISFPFMTERLGHLLNFVSKVSASLASPCSWHWSVDPRLHRFRVHRQVPRPGAPHIVINKGPPRAGQRGTFTNKTGSPILSSLHLFLCQGPSWTFSREWWGPLYGRALALTGSLFSRRTRVRPLSPPLLPCPFHMWARSHSQQSSTQQEQRSPEPWRRPEHSRFSIDAGPTQPSPALPTSHPDPQVSL